MPTAVMDVAFKKSRRVVRFAIGQLLIVVLCAARGGRALRTFTGYFTRFRA